MNAILEMDLPSYLRAKKTVDDRALNSAVMHASSAGEDRTPNRKHAIWW